MKDNVHVHLPFRFLKKNIKLVLDNRINVEIYFSGNCLDNYPLEEIFEVQRILEESNIRLSFHAPYMDLSPGGVDRLVNEITLKRMQQILSLAERFKPKVIVVHPGYDDWRYGEHIDEWLENSVKTWKRVIEMSSHLETIIAIENVFEKTPDTLSNLIKAVDSPRFRYCLDTGHFNLFSEIAFEDWFERIGHYIEEIHLHDNFGKEDEHLAIGEGKFDFPLLFDLLETHGCSPLLTVEAKNKEKAMKSLGYLKAI